MRHGLMRAILLGSACLVIPGVVGGGNFEDPVNAVQPPPDAPGYPSRDAGLDALAGFQNPPAGYGQVPFWWWTGDPLDLDRLTWQIEELHRKGVSGMQVNYAHEDTPGWPTYAAEPPIFSGAWWEFWGKVAAECRKRGMGIGLSTYTLDWPNTRNLFQDLFYSKPELNAYGLKGESIATLQSGESIDVEAPDGLVAARAYPVHEETVTPGGLDLRAEMREGRLQWKAPYGEWEVWLISAERAAGTINPLLEGVGEIVIRDFYQRFQDAAPDKSYEGLNYFFNDELHIGAGNHVWNEDFADEFKKRKGYDLFEVLPALWRDIGPRTPKVRIDYADVRMSLMEERYFQPIYQWHASRGLIFACDSGGRGRDPYEFGDYFRATRWYTAPGHDTPGGNADLIKGKVSSSIANLYRRPRVWLEGYHSLGWGATPERIMYATRENYLYGCTLLNLHGLYYTTHGSFWEWAPPCYHFRMPYWEHMDVFFRYWDRLSYLMSQGSLVSDVAVIYPVAPYEAGMDGGKARDTAFNTARHLMSAGVNFEFVDAGSLARATVHDGRLEVADSSYRALVVPAMDAMRWASLDQARRFAEAGGLVLNVGTLPTASDRAGREDSLLDALVAETFTEENRLAAPEEVPPRILAAFTPDTRAEKPLRSHHRRVGPRDVYLVMDATKNSAVEFRAKGKVEIWDPWTGDTKPLHVVAETDTGTRVELPLENYEAQIVVFTPGEEHTNPAPQEQQATREIALDGEWTFELAPTMDNRFGDFRLPVTDDIIGPEARLFRHAVEKQGDVAWQERDLDDSNWEKVTCGFGPQMQVLGPLPPEAFGDTATTAALEAKLAALSGRAADEPVVLDGETRAWKPYSFSWRWGLEGDPGHQGWHGLKENVTDHFLCLGKPAGGHNETRYVDEDPSGIYYVWTAVTVEEPTDVRILSSAATEGETPHGSNVLEPVAVYVNGSRVDGPEQPISLRAGANPILVRYDAAGRGYFVMKRVDAESAPTERTPLAMRWYDDPGVLRFDVRAGERPAEWFRFIAPPGLKSMRVAARGSVSAWADGEPMRAEGGGRFAPGQDECLEQGAVIALRVEPETGYCGGALLPEPIRIETGPGVAALGDWSQMGVLECYSGGVRYGKSFDLKAEDAGGRVTLDLGKVAATAGVRVNGREAGVRVAPPWQVDISDCVQAGENRVEIEVYNTLANHYMTVPSRYRGDASARVSGLIGPVKLACEGKSPE